MWLRATLASVVLAITVGAVAYVWDHGIEQSRARARAAALTNGSWRTGQALYVSRGCGACHRLNGASLPQGEVGPDLSGVSRRAYIAGRLRNTPDQMIGWLRHPQSVNPDTAMPDLTLSDAEARALAAFLYAPG